MNTIISIVLGMVSMFSLSYLICAYFVDDIKTDKEVTRLILQVFWISTGFFACLNADFRVLMSVIALSIIFFIVEE